MLHREAVQFTPLRTERPCTARPLFREEAMFGDGLLGESGQVCPHTFFFFFFLVFVSPDKSGRGSGWQRGFCCGAPWLTMAPVWGWRLCFVFPGEITPSSALQGETVQNYAAAEWKQSLDCSGIQVIPPFWFSAATAIKHAPSVTYTPKKL